MTSLAALQNDPSSGVPQGVDEAAAWITDLAGELGRGMCLGLLGHRDELAGHLARGAAAIGSHRKRGVVLSAMMLLDRRARRGGSAAGAALRNWFASANEESLHTIKSLLRTARPPVTRLRALEWLGDDALGSAPADRLARATTVIEHELVLINAHLLANPRRAARAAGIALKTVAARPGARTPDPASIPRHVLATESPVPPQAILSKLSAESRRAIPRFARALKSSPMAQRIALEPLLTDPDVLARHAAVRASPLGGLADFCLDRDERIARSAMIAHSGAGDSGRSVNAQHDPGRARLLGALVKSEHATVRAWAESDLASDDPWSVTPAGRVAARRRRHKNPESFIIHIRAGLERTDTRLRALMLVRALGLAGEFEAPLLELASADARDAESTRAAATAVSALGEVRSDRSKETALRCLVHSDDRVRANAVEAITRQSSDLARPSSVFIELKSDRNHRVRANAMRALVTGSDDPDGAADSMASMLTDDRVMHRLAGVWLASRTLAGAGRDRIGERWPELIARVGEIARYDPDPRVRRRATSCAARVDAVMRTSWRRGVCTA